MEDVSQRMLEAEQFRVAEFSPGHYDKAKQALTDAKAYLADGKNEKAIKALDESSHELMLAMQVTQTVSGHFSKLVESRDRMQMTDATYLRDDLVERAEDDFNHVVTAVENDDMGKAEDQAKLALNTLRAAQVVALREQYVLPVVRGIAAGRKVHARDYAPLASDEAKQTQKDIEKLIKEDPDAQVKMYQHAKQGEYKANHAIKIATLGNHLRKNQAEVERLVNAEEERLNLLGKRLGVDLSSADGVEEQAAMLNAAIEAMEKNYQRQLQDSDAEVAKLNAKLGIYEGDLAGMNDLRRKLQLKRDAEEKIKQLTKLFNPSDVEILLTPDADVILRMKSLNFRSGSAVIPPNAYVMLDAAMKSMAMFSNRAVRIEGHTDSVGANLYNQELSERRSNSVKEYVAGKVEHEGAVESIGYGEEKPIANNETAKGREKNRRIDIVLLAPQS